MDSAGAEPAANVFRGVKAGGHQARVHEDEAPAAAVRVQDLPHLTRWM